MAKLSSATYQTSDLSRYCDERLPGDFNYLDGDVVILRYPAQPIAYARETRILRILESKRPGEQIRRSQVDVFPILAASIHQSVAQGQLANGSGVFIIEGTYPYEDGADVRQVLPHETSRTVGLQYLGPKRITNEELNAFLRCRIVKEFREELRKAS